MNWLRRVLKQWFQLCEHQWELVLKGNLESYWVKHDKTTIDGHFEDYKCMKCMKAKRLKWEHP